MELSIKHIGLFLLGLILAALPAFAETSYVSDEMHITFRSGPASDRKIIKLLISGQPVEVQQKEGEWAMVRLPDGKQGWVLHRYLTPEEPCDMVLERLSASHAALTERADTLDTENRSLKSSNKTLTDDLATTQTDLQKTRTALNKLKEESATYLALKAEHQKAASQLSEQTRRVGELENDLARAKNNYKMFITGACILVVGLVIGLLSRAQKRKSSLL
jgi:SH3 domain protein